MMNNKERELKLLISKEKFNEILKSYEFPYFRQQTNIYFDTPDQKVKKEGCAVRIRTYDDHCIFTLKKRIDPITLIELEKEIDTTDIHRISDSEVLDWLKEYHIPIQDLYPTAKITTKRYILKTKQAEICLDHTLFSHSQDYEIEYEYFEDHDGVKEFNEFLGQFGLHYTKNCPSKIARAMNS